jgi:hypothetical protein
MSAKSFRNTGALSLVPPAEVQALFGDPPLLRGEDVKLYDNLMGHFARIVEPKDMIEWWWVKDITDHCWEIRRLRRFKVLLIELGRDEMYRWHESQANLLAKHGAYERPPMPESEKDSANLFMPRIGKYQSIDRLVASAELRRAHTLREIERRREYLARRLREASDEIIASEFAPLPQAA